MRKTMIVLSSLFNRPRVALQSTCGPGPGARPSVRLSPPLPEPSTRTRCTAPGAGADAMEGDQPALSAEELTTPSLKKAQTPPLHEDANTAVIAVVITLVFLTLLTVLVVIVTYLYRNKGTYLTYEAPAEPERALPLEDAPAREKEEYFI